MNASESPPISSAELAETVETIRSADGPFKTVPMTVGDIDYPHVFALSNVSLREVLAMKAAEHHDKTFMVYDDERYLTKDVWARSMRFAHWLNARGVGQGDRVAIAMRNYPEWAMAYFGIIASGATVVPLNAWWQAEELCEGMERSRAKFLIADDKRGAAIEPVKERLGITFIAGRDAIPQADVQLTDILSDESLSTAVPETPIDPDSDYCLLFTSGSTGKPKGALLTHRGVVSAVLSWAFLLEAMKLLRPKVDLSPPDAASLMTLPLFHVTGLHSMLLLGFLSGRKQVFLYRWDPQTAIDLIKKEEVTHFFGVPTMAHDLIKAAKPGDLDTLVDIGSGGAKRPEAQVASQRLALPNVAASSGYGLTETNALGTHIALGDYKKHPSAAGRAVPPVTEIAAFSESGEKLEPGEVGEIAIKSPANMRGYADDPDATAAAFFAGGWFRTGDVGRVDKDGFVTIMDRLKDLIIRGGENVSCLEVENVLHEFGGVDEVAVFAVPHEALGEVVGAAIYGRDDLSFEALQSHAKERLAGFKVPTRFWRAPTHLPRGATGKIDKKMIRTLTREREAAYQNGDD